MNDLHAPALERPRGALKSTSATEVRADARGSKNPFDVDQLVRRCMGRIELAERLLKSFESRFPEDLSKIEECLREDDSPGLPRLVHQLKGAAANVSAPDLYSILARMEQAVQSDERAAAHDCVEEIHETWEGYLEFKSLNEKH